jgi:hypothetical protein
VTILELPCGLAEGFVDRGIRIGSVRVQRGISRHEDASVGDVELDPHGVVAAVTVVTMRDVHGDVATDDARGEAFELLHVMADALAGSVAVRTITEVDLERNEHATASSSSRAKR